MDRLRERASYIEIRDFLNNVYIHLSNDVPDQQRRKQLMSRCMHFIEILEQNMEHTTDHTDAVGSSSFLHRRPDQPYLDMSKSGFSSASTPLQSPKKTPTECNHESAVAMNSSALSEYVDVTSPSSTTTTTATEEDNVNYVNQSPNLTLRDTNTSLYDQLRFEGWSQLRFNSSTSNEAAAEANSTALQQQLDTNECPFGGLPATHLPKRQTNHIGWLTVPRRYFSKRTKRYFAGVLDGWFILYAGGDTALRPSGCHCVRKCSWSDASDSNGKLQLIFVTDTPKKKQLHFLMGSREELQTWLDAFSETRPNLNLFGARKLPTPPPNSSGANLPSQQLSNSSAGSSSTSTISLEMETNPDKSGPIQTSSSGTENVEEIYEEPVELLSSLARIKKASKQKLVVVEVAQEYDIPKSRPKLVATVDDQLIVPQIADATKPKTTAEGEAEVVDCFQDIKTKLTAQLIVNQTPSSIQIRNQKSEKSVDPGPASSPNRKSDMRSWLYRISRRGRRSLIHVVTKSNRDVVEKNDVIASRAASKIIKEHPFDDLQELDESPGGKAHVKGSKVNQIINQLEANGHRAPMFKVAITRSKLSHKIASHKKQSINDEHNYEPVTVVTS